MRKADNSIGKLYSKPWGESEGWNVRCLCTEGMRDVKDREGIITLHAFASWAKKSFSIECLQGTKFKIAGY